MTKAEILKEVMASHLKEDDFFDAGIFYYLCGRYPNLTIRRCVEIVEYMRGEVVDAISQRIEERGKEGTQV